MLYRTAIIGCGNIAGGYDSSVPTKWSATHAGAYHLCPETKLVAVADTDPHNLKAFRDKWQVERGYTDCVKMLQKEKIDILSLCLPTEHHFEAFQAAINHNIKAIFCEKPLSHDLDEAYRMFEMSQGRIVSVNYFRRFNPTLADIVKALQRGDFGKGINVTIRYTKGLFVNGSHFIDLMRWIWGEPKSLDFIKITQIAPIDPGIDFSLNFDDGVAAYFINIPEIDYVFADVDMMMEKGRLVIGQRGQTLSKYSVVREPHYNLFDILGNAQEIETQWRNCTTRAVQEIVDCLRSGGSTSCTAEDGYRAMEICHKVIAQKGANV